QLHSAEVQLEDKGLAYYPLRIGAVPYTNQGDTILDLALDLMSLKGVRRKNLIDTLTTIRFSTTKPVKLLVGYFRQKDLAFVAERYLSSYAPTHYLDNYESAYLYGQF